MHTRGYLHTHPETPLDPPSQNRRLGSCAGYGHDIEKSEPCSCSIKNCYTSNVNPYSPHRCQGPSSCIHMGEEKPVDNEETPLFTRPLPHDHHRAKCLRSYMKPVKTGCLILVITACIAVLIRHSTPVRSSTSGPEHPLKMDVIREDRCLRAVPGSSEAMSCGSTSTSLSASPLRSSSSETLADDYELDQDTLASSKSSRDPPKLPHRAKKVPWTITLQNETLVDNYHWLHEKQDSDVKDYIKAESEYTAAWLGQSGIDALQKQLDSEMAQISNAVSSLPLITEGVDDREFVAIRQGGRLERTTFWDLDGWRYWLDESMGSYGIYKRRLLTSMDKLDVKNTDLNAGQGCSADFVPLSTVQEVLDVNELAERHAEEGRFALGSVEVQPKSTFLTPDPARVENKDIYMAYIFDVTEGSEIYSIGIHVVPHMDMPREKSRSELLTIKGVPIKDASTDLRWVKHGSSLYLYFTRLDSKGLAREVWRVRVDEKQHEPEFVLRDDDQSLTVSVSTTADGRYLLIGSIGLSTTQVYISSMDHPEQGWTLIRPAEKNVKYKVEHHFGYFYIHTNQGTPNFKVLRYPVKSILSGHDSLGDSVPARVRTLSPSSDNKSFLDNMKDDVVLMYDPSEFMQRLIVFARYFVTWAWRDGLQEIRIYSAPQPGNKNVTLSLTEIQRIRPYRENVNVVTVVPSTGRDFDDRVFMDYNSSKLQYSNSSYVHPWALYEVDMDMLTPVESRHDGSNSNDGTRLMSATTLVCQNPFPLNVMYGESTSQPTLDIKTHKDFRAMHQQAIARYKEERIMVPSRQSGISIPVTLVYYQFPDRPQFPRKAAFVKAYGAYGVMTKPDYDPGTILPLLHRGVIWVKVHPRGDGNMGPEWRTSGQGEHKRNTFYDIEDALVFLRDSGMVAKEGVVFEGMSAGGMDSGWIANRWGDEATPSRLPYNRIGQSENIVREMVKAVMAQVPFMDVLKGMGDPNVPWVEYEWAEWGSPLNDKRVFEAMKTFSPYDNIRHQDYPAMMLTGELADTRVSYAEALKFVAKLRSTDGKTNDCQPVHDKANEDGERRKMCAGKNDTPLLFQIGNGGHFGSSISLWMAFGLHQLDAEDVVIT